MIGSRCSDSRGVMTPITLFILMCSSHLSSSEEAAGYNVEIPELVECRSLNCEATEKSEEANDLLLLQTSMELGHLVAQSPMDAVSNTSDVVVTTTIGGSAAALTGVSTNAAGDLAAFISAVITNGFMWFFCVGVASFLRLKYPEIYAHNQTDGKTKIMSDLSSFLGWVQGSLQTSIDDAIPTIGLDNAMLLEFSNLCMKILGTISVPLVCIMCPLHLFCGGGRSGEDHLSAIAMGNVVDFHPWLYWCHAACVWMTIIVCRVYIWGYQRKFVERRFKWLREMEAPRACTVLVEGIPVEYQSDAKLKEFFGHIFGAEKICSACTVKQTDQLCTLISQRDADDFKLREAQAKAVKDGGARVKVRKSLIDSTEVDAIDLYAASKADLDAKISQERAQVKELAQKSVGGVNGENGFVTFLSQREREVAVHLNLSEDIAEWVVSVPPEPESIRWADLKMHSTLSSVNSFIGYSCVAALYIGFMPICIFVTNLATAINLGPLWTAFAPTLGLLLFLSFLPTFLLLIFHYFFSLKADSFAQHRLQIWYFWFQVFFVILVTAIGTSLLTFISTLAQDPFAIFRMLANQLPWATHFYMNYLVLQIGTHSMNFMRYVVFFKYLGFCQVWQPDDARKMAEPEDQDYYGIGGRSARWAINMLIGIIFGTLSPLCAVLAFINFAVCRLLYGYMIVFAETPKADLGGVFWVSKLGHVWSGCIIYAVLMVGVLSFRAPTWGPMAVCVPAFLLTIYWRYSFNHAFHWETLPFKEVIGEHAHHFTKKSGSHAYEQPELIED